MKFSDWKLAQLAEVADVFNGKTPSKTDQRSQGHPVLKIKDVDEKARFRGEFESFVDDAFANRFATKKARLGDSLILNAAHNASYVASKTYRIEEAAVGSLLTGEWLVVRPDENMLDPAFAYHWVNLPITRAELRASVKGIHLYPRDVAALELKIPPLPEQRRIAAILDQADALRAKRREALACLNELIHSIFVDMFGDSRDESRRYPWVTLAEVCNGDFRNGVSPSKAGTIEGKVLTLSAVTGSAFDPRAVKTAKFSTHPPESQRVSTENLLVCRGNGNRNLVGRGYFATRSMPDTTFPDTVIAARADLTQCSKKYLETIWNSSTVREQLEQSARTTNGTFKINQQILSTITFPLPDFARQEEFERKVHGVEQYRDQLHHSSKWFETLFASLASCLFGGVL